MCEHKGYKLSSRSHEISDTNKWTTSIEISRGDLCKPFDAPETHNTQNEADSFSIQYGIQIIDGKYSNCEIGF